MSSPPEHELNPRLLRLRSFYGYCMAIARGPIPGWHGPPLNHECFLAVGHEGPHRCADGCDYEWSDVGVAQNG